MDNHGRCRKKGYTFSALAGSFGLAAIVFVFGVFQHGEQNLFPVLMAAFFLPLFITAGTWLLYSRRENCARNRMAEWQEKVDKQI
jgi:lipopolysaccharide export LptBFGC system permease protein LptF